MYRIITENVNKESIIDSVLPLLFDGWTIYEAQGAYKGKLENTLIIEIETENYARVMDTAHLIRRINNQESVLVQHVPTTAYFVDSTFPDCRSEVAADSGLIGL